MGVGMSCSGRTVFTGGTYSYGSPLEAFCEASAPHPGKPHYMEHTDTPSGVVTWEDGDGFEDFYDPPSEVIQWRAKGGDG